jgi:hypothetical protein
MKAAWANSPQARTAAPCVSACCPAEDGDQVAQALDALLAARQQVGEVQAGADGQRPLANRCRVSWHWSAMTSNWLPSSALSSGCRARRGRY